MFKTLTFLFLILCAPLSGLAQTEFRIMGYNVENLFDTEKSTVSNDSEFLPSGHRRWNKGRYYHKLQQIAKVISAAGQWDTPAIVALCEVENDSVVNHLLKRTPLKKQDYRYCITSGNDERGINCALLYQRDKFQYLNHTEYTVPFSNLKKKSRNLLHVSGRLTTKDTLDIFVCHFPSRYGGEKETEKDRAETAIYLRKLSDSLYTARANCLLILIGDFNDTPQDKSLRTHLEAYSLQEKENESKTGLNLCNLFFNTKGSHKYRDTWSQLDQIIISSTLLRHFQTGSNQVFSPSFLLTKDKTWQGKRPFRSYHGYKYEKGFSDHLPVIADFNF